MKLPTKLKIGGLLFRVIYTDHNDGPLDGYGACDIGNVTIYISEALPPKQQMSTLIHEILEAINGMYELQLNHTQICVLESGLYQVLTDNHLLKEK